MDLKCGIPTTHVDLEKFEFSIDLVGKSKGNHILKGVSRSFYLSLRLLPKKMREAASIGYLLARSSDTLADTVRLNCVQRADYLDQFSAAISCDRHPPKWSMVLLNSIENRKERLLLESSQDIFHQYRSLPPGEKNLVEEVIVTIISGQKLDLLRFKHASAEHPVALLDSAALMDYTWRVAGSVGEFWTKLGYLTMGSGYSRADVETMTKRAASYGNALQLVNILRDVPEDLAEGRCYLPVKDPGNREELLESHRSWVVEAQRLLEQGSIYSAELLSRRLRAATLLPSLIAEKTLARMENATWPSLRRGIKITRGEIYRTLCTALTSPAPKLPVT